MKILIVYAKAGAGHKRAAEAVFEAFKRKGEEKDVTIIDCLDYTNPWFKNFYPNSYIFLVRFLPLVWAGIYYSLENRAFYSLIEPFRHWNNQMVTKRFMEFLKREKPQVVISTQFFASDMVAILKRKKELNTTLISVVTDFGAHTFWESEDVDIFVVASEDTKQDLLARHIPEQKIKVLGIPIDTPLKGFNKIELRKKVGLKENLFTVLIVGGGFGVGPIKELVSSLDKLSDDVRDKVQLLVVCSRNEKLYQEMKGLSSQINIEARIFGFVDNIYEMMAASDVIISKSGGLTTSEALSYGLPMIIISPIPGQETKNCDLLVKNGAAIRIDRAFQVRRAIEELLNIPGKLEKMRKSATFLARPNSADDIVNLADSQIESQ